MNLRENKRELKEYFADFPVLMQFIHECPHLTYGPYTIYKRDWRQLKPPTQVVKYVTEVSYNDTIHMLSEWEFDTVEEISYYSNHPDYVWSYTPINEEDIIGQLRFLLNQRNELRNTNQQR